MDRVLLKSSETDKICGIYCLFSKQHLSYVGQSVNVRLRIATHRSEGRIPFDDAVVFKCMPGDMDELESVLIRNLLPDFNRALFPCAENIHDIKTCRCADQRAFNNHLYHVLYKTLNQTK